MFDRVTAVLAQSRTEYFGLRSMDPMRDLGGVADLIEEAFATELDHSGQNALRELRLLSRMKPILWWMTQFNPDHSDFLSGFVWKRMGKLWVILQSIKPRQVHDAGSLAMWPFPRIIEAAVLAAV
jgi:hypothetical protein